MAAAVHAAATTGKDGEAEIIIDSAATITALKSVDQMVDTHASKRKIHGFAKGSGINAATDGKANMWLFDPESGDGAGATVPAVAFEELRKEILSLPYMVKILGFNCDLRTEGWEGLYKLDHQGRKVCKIPIVYDPDRRLWFSNYTTGQSIDDAKKRAGDGGKWERLYITEESETLLHADFTIDTKEDNMLQEDDTTVTLTSRSRERVLTQMQRHRKLLHLGPSGKGCTCLICKQIRGNHRQVYKDGRNSNAPYRNPTPKYDEYAGNTIHADSAYWDVESIEGSWYTVNMIDDKTSWMGGVNLATRDTAGIQMMKYIDDKRSCPELNNPNFCKILMVDPAGEWHTKNLPFMKLATERNIRVILRHGKSDKRMNSRAETGIQKLKSQVQAGLLDARLDACWWERLVNYAWHTRNLYPIRRNAASGASPLEEMSNNNVSREEVERRIEYCLPPGRLALVHDPGKHGGALDISKSRLGISRRMDGDTCVFENVNTGKHEFYSKNFYCLDMRPGLSAHAYMRIQTDPNKKPRACLPRDGRPNAEQFHMVQLPGIVHGAQGEHAVLQEITGQGDVLPSCITYDATGRILAPDENFEMKPTGGFVQIIEADQVTEADRARQRDLLLDIRSKHPEWLIGAEVNKRFDEWGGVARGFITAYDQGYTDAWTVTYEADGVEEEFDSTDIKRYVIDNVHGKANADGGLSLYERYKKGIDPPDCDMAEWGDGQTVHPQDVHIPKHFNTYSTLNHDTWSDVCNAIGIKSTERREYFQWLRQFKIGNAKEFRGRQSEGYIFFANPFGQSKMSVRFEANTKFPIPDTALREESVSMLRAREAHNEANAESAMLDYVLSLIDKHRGDDYIGATINTAPGVPPIDPRETVDQNGIPVPPKDMVELSRREFGEMWVAAWKKEWKGLEDHEIFIHGLTVEQLESMGIMGGRDGKKVVRTQMLFEAKLLDGLFSRYKARLVANGHPGAVRKGIDYTTVFAAAPHLQSQRIMRAFEVLLGWEPIDWDIAQAYLLGRAEKDQRYPVRYPEGPIRDMFRCPKTGKERLALVVGNIYGLPPAGRTYAKERNRLILEVLPINTGWSTRKLTREPCMYEIKTDIGLSYMLVHTDDCDLVIQDKRDVKRLIDEFNKLFGIKGNDGIKVGDGKDMLGIHRKRWTDSNGVRLTQLTQAGNIEATWEKFKSEREAMRKRPPSVPFPIDDDHPKLDNNNKVTDVTEAEAQKVRDKGFRQILGSELWPMRCTAPELSYACSVLSKCMATPPETAWRAALHVAHWMYQHRYEGLTFSSHGNLEPVCYYDSGYKQKKLFDKPQYGYVIFWAGVPIISNSKRHGQIPQSVSQAEFETITHAWRDVKWLREFLKELGLSKYVEAPTPMIGDNRNARDWAMEDVMADGNRHFEHRYFTVRERVDAGEIMMHWISGKLNPADIMTKAVDKGATDALLPILQGRQEIPLPGDVKVWFGPYENAVHRGNLAAG